MGGGGYFRHSAFQTDFEFEISGSLVSALRPRSIAEVMSGRSVILSTLFLVKPPGGRLPVLSAHPFAIN